MAYYAQTAPRDYYAMYTAHNYQFLDYSTAMEGRRAETLEAVQNLRNTIPDAMLLAMPGFDWPIAEKYAALVRFGLWDRMLAEPAPDPRLPALTAGFLYGKGVALAATGQIAPARDTLAQLQHLIEAMPADAAAGFNCAKDIAGIASLIVQARIAEAEHRTRDAIALLRRAADDEDALAYDEPRDWFFPVRHLLGAQLLNAGQAAAAEAVYRADLERNPANGWSLCRLRRALSAQNKHAQAAAAQRAFQQAWAHADIS